MANDNYCIADSVCERAILIKIPESCDHLIKGAHKNSPNTVIDRFCLRLHLIESEASNNEKRLLELIAAFNNEIEQLKQSLLGNIRLILQNVDNTATALQAYRALQKLYPIFTLYTTTNGEEKIPRLKQASIKVVFMPLHEDKNIKKYVEETLPKKYKEQLFQCDLDRCLISKSIRPSDVQKNSLAIRLFGSPEIMLREIEEIKKIFNDDISTNQDILKIVVRPDQTDVLLEPLLFEKYPETKELLQKTFGQ